jgi:hypothetical protein
VLVSTEDASTALLFPDRQLCMKGLEREKEEYRISAKLLRTDYGLIWSKLGTISLWPVL